MIDHSYIAVGNFASILRKDLAAISKGTKSASPFPRSQALPAFRFRVGYKPSFRNETYLDTEIQVVCCDGFREKDGFCVGMDLYLSFFLFGWVNI